MQKSEREISPKTLEMIESGLEELKRGNASGPVDMEEDFPRLFDDED